MSNDRLRSDARAIWDASLTAVDPFERVRETLAANSNIAKKIANARRIVVVGGGKAGAAMAAGVEVALANRLSDLVGIINVPTGCERPLRSLTLNIARAAGTNEPTAAGVDGARQMLHLVETADPSDLVLALISGGGSALLPAPVDGVSLEDKQAMTRFLHRSGATIAELNCVRKHLSRIKGGGLAAATRCSLVALIISDVVGDPLNVIASGPTAPDPTTFADALDVLRKFDLVESVPAATRYLKAGARGERPETSKTLPQSVTNVILANNRRALSAAAKAADIRGYNLVDLGSFVEGETRDVARVAAAIVRSTASDGIPTPPPACILIGGETTVTLPPAHGRGGRNTEFVLAGLLALESAGLNGYVVLSGGTDGEDGPTDAAGAIGDHATLATARRLGLDPADSLRRHDSYTFFDATGDLFRTGLTQTNVMDVRVLLIDRP